MGSSTNGSTVPTNGRSSSATGSIFVNTLKSFHGELPSGMSVKVLYFMQEMDFECPSSSHRFLTSEERPFLITQGVKDKFGEKLAWECLSRLQALAVLHKGLDYVQLFQILEPDLTLVFGIDAGYVKACLPDEHPNYKLLVAKPIE